LYGMNKMENVHIFRWTFLVNYLLDASFH